MSNPSRARFSGEPVNFTYSSEVMPLAKRSEFMRGGYQSARPCGAGASGPEAPARDGGALGEGAELCPHHTVGHQLRAREGAEAPAGRGDHGPPVAPRLH